MAGGAGLLKRAQAGATLCNSSAEVYRSAQNRSQKPERDIFDFWLLVSDF
jgi:hypothetical protein